MTDPLLEALAEKIDAVCTMLNPTLQGRQWRMLRETAAALRAAAPEQREPDGYVMRTAGPRIFPCLVYSPEEARMYGDAYFDVPVYIGGTPPATPEVTNE